MCHAKQLITPAAHRTLLHKPKTFKFPGIHWYFTATEAGRQALLDYDYFLLSDDDVNYRALHAEEVAGRPEPDAVEEPSRLHRVFEAQRLCGASIAQPSLSERSASNFAITKTVSYPVPAEEDVLDDSVTAAGDDPTGGGGGLVPVRFRAVRLVEQMAPFFSREALQRFLPYFEGLTHAWGIDALWSDQSDRLQKPLAIFDSLRIDHMRPSGVSGLYKRVGGIEKAREEQQNYKRRHGIRDEFVELMEPAHEGEGDRRVVRIPVARPKE
jgi:hypothetical protein